MVTIEQLEARFKLLIATINNARVNNNPRLGNVGICIKSTLFDRNFPVKEWYPKNLKWTKFLHNQVLLNQRIKIYKAGKFYWFVLPEKEEDFKLLHPKWEIQIMDY